jgi:capsid protein
VDPLKEASAQAQRLASNTTTLAAEYAKQGKDWETELRQRAKEVALMKELGLPLVAPKGATIEPQQDPDGQQSVKEDTGDEEQRQSKAA